MARSSTADVTRVDAQVFLSPLLAYLCGRRSAVGAWVLRNRQSQLPDISWIEASPKSRASHPRQHSAIGLLPLRNDSSGLSCVFLAAHKGDPFLEQRPPTPLVSHRHRHPLLEYLPGRGESPPHSLVNQLGHPPLG